MSDYENPPKGFEMAGWDNDALRAREATEADIERLQAENDELRARINETSARGSVTEAMHVQRVNDIARLEARVAELETEKEALMVYWRGRLAAIDRMHEALTFYSAQWKSYCGDHGVPIGTEPTEELLADRGETAKAALAAYSATPAPSPWRYDVENAPKDGSEFDALLNDARVIVYFYLDNSDKPYPWAGFRPRYGAEKPGQKMIAWMPRPVAPESEGESNG